MIQKDCPVDFIQVNEYKVRLTALWVFILVTVSLLAIPFPIAVFLTFDFFLRAFNFGKNSLLNILSNTIAKQFKIPNKPIDQAPKRFAAKIGFILSLAISIAVYTQFFNVALVMTIVFSIFAFLESFMGFCAGCYVYTFLQHIKLIR